MRQLDANGDPTGNAIGAAIPDLAGSDNEYSRVAPNLVNGTTVTFGLVIATIGGNTPVTSAPAGGLPFSVSLSKSTVSNDGYGTTATVDFESSHSDGFSHYQLNLISVSDGSGFVTTLSVLTATLTPDANSTAKYTLNDGELGYGCGVSFRCVGGQFADTELSGWYDDDCRCGDCRRYCRRIESEEFLR